MNLQDNLKQLETNSVYNLLKSTGNKIYIVGGALRDLISGRVTPAELHDFDIIVTDESAKDFAYKFKDYDSVQTVITLDEINNIYRIIMKDKTTYIDVTNPINNSLKDDLLRRDITINSVALDINTYEIIDLASGIDDLNNKIIRGISKENFLDDPLRMLRVFRFASTLGFEIEPKTIEYIKENKGRIIMPAQERINTEVLKLFGGKFADKTIELMDGIGLIDILFPIMIDVKKVPPNTHHHLDLFKHSISTVKYIQEIYETSQKEVQEHLESVDFGGESRLAHLKLAGFMHDIGKFSTWTIEEDGRHRFIRHDEIGEELAKGILKKAKFSKKQIEYIAFIIRNHIYPSSVISAPNLSDKILMRYIRKAQDNSIDLITIAKADRLSARGVAVTDEMVKENIDGLNNLQDFYIKVKPTLKPIPKLISGEEIMKIRKIKPSKELGEIINALHDRQLEGVINTTEEAEEFVKTYTFGD